MRSQKITATTRWEICLYKGNRKQPVAEGSNWTWAWTVCFWWGVDWMRPPASTVWLTVRSTTSGWQVKHNSFHLNELLAKCKSVHLQAFFQPLLLQLCTCAKHQLWSAAGAAKTEFITFFVWRRCCDWIWSHFTFRNSHLEPNSAHFGTKLNGHLNCEEIYESFETQKLCCKRKTLCLKPVILILLGTADIFKVTTCRNPSTRRLL